MDNGLKFPSRLYALNHRGTLERSEERPCGWPSNGVGGLKTPRPDREGAGQPKRKSSWSRQARKAVWGAYRTSVP